MSQPAEEPVRAVAISGEADLLRVRSTLRAEAERAGLGLTAATKLITAGSELARNIVRYATRRTGAGGPGGSPPSWPRTCSGTPSPAVGCWPARCHPAASS